MTPGDAVFVTVLALAFVWLWSSERSQRIALSHQVSALSQRLNEAHVGLDIASARLDTVDKRLDHAARERRGLRRDKR